MSDLKFTREHKWLRPEADDSVTVGITDYAQQQLGDVVYVELPAPGDRIDADKDFAVIESVKTASDISIPLNGTVIGINSRLDDEPELLNDSPLDEGWLVRIDAEDTDALAELLDEDAYASMLENLD